MMIDYLKTFFGLSTNSKDLGYWILVDFSDEAKQNSVGADCLKKIMHMSNRNPFQIENYSEAKIKLLRKDRVPIFDRTAGRQVPSESQFIKPLQQILGQIQMVKRI